MMKNRIVRQQDVNGNYTTTRFQIGGRDYIADNIGTDVWNVRFSTGLAVPLLDADNERLRRVMRELLEAAQLAAMNNDPR